MLASVTRDTMLLSLPEELIQHVLTHGAELQSVDFIRACRNVNRQMRSLVEAEASKWNSFYTTKPKEIPPIPWECFPRPQHLILYHSGEVESFNRKSISVLREWARAGAFRGNLTSLNVSSCRLSEEAVAMMCQEGAFTGSLTFLDISDNNICPSGAKHIATGIETSGSLTQVLAFSVYVRPSRLPSFLH